MNALGIVRMTSVSGAMLLLGASCVHVASDPIEVKPIHATLDINIRVQKELENFFNFEDDILKNPGGPSTRQVKPAAPVESAPATPDGQ